MLLFSNRLSTQSGLPLSRQSFHVKAHAHIANVLDITDGDEPGTSADLYSAQLGSKCFFLGWEDLSFEDRTPNFNILQITTPNLVWVLFENTEVRQLSGFNTA